MSDSATVWSDAAARDAAAKLERLAGTDIRPFFDSLLRDVAEPTNAIVQFERWLHSATNPSTQLEFLLESPRIARLLLVLFGASQEISSALIQNPELASLITDPQFLAQVPHRHELLAEGKRLISAATGFKHSLDRLRYLRQCWMIRIAMNDLAGAWDQPVVWRALSDLAESIVELAREVSWREYAANKSLDWDCPVSIAAFGKLGGRELNYSSDIDLVYVLEDFADESIERHAIRYCELFGRSLTDFMGRGALYRLDLRLRPYGASGPIAPTMRAVEAYYRSHAEEWEFQALLKSRVISGSKEISERWENLRVSHAFRAKLAEGAVQDMLTMRQRIEQRVGEDDIKRGSGGIRDIEFFVQILQRVHAFGQPKLQARNTLEALSALVEFDTVTEPDGASLAESYIFLRKLEHRLQLHGRQTHSLPSEEVEQRRLAHLMGFADWNSLSSAINSTRVSVRKFYGTLSKSAKPFREPRDAVMESSGGVGQLIAKWFDLLPESERFYQSLNENDSSLERVRTVAMGAPVLIDRLAHSVGITESIIDGQIEDDLEVGSSISSAKGSIESLAVAARSEWERIIVRAALCPELIDHLGRDLTQWADAVMSALAERLNLRADILSLGSYGVRDLGVESDCDVLFLVDTIGRYETAENQVQDLMHMANRLKQLGVPFVLDLRLRPEGRKGLLVRTYEGFDLYELTSMEMWERFSLGQARLVWGSNRAEQVVLECAYGQPLTGAHLDELLRMKLRIETERVQVKHARRDVKLGIGGLSDIEWVVRLYEMRWPPPMDGTRPIEFEDRIRFLARNRQFNAVECDRLIGARQHHRRVRAKLAMLGFAPNLIPENPDKLDMLGRSFGFPDGNAFLAEHEQVISMVRALYNDAIERLRE